MSQPAVFFDRDGVLIKTNVINGKAYAIKSLSELVILPNALELIQAFKQDGYKIIVVTNQPDVGNGFVPRSEVEAMNARLLAELPIDLIKVCYHKQTDNCACRKPRTAMFSDAANELNIDLSNSIMIGDRSSDVVAGHAVGCFTIFIDYGYNEPLELLPDLIVSSLTDVLQLHTKGVRIKNERNEN